MLQVPLHACRCGRSRILFLMDSRLADHGREGLALLGKLEKAVLGKPSQAWLCQRHRSDPGVFVGLCLARGCPEPLQTSPGWGCPQGSGSVFSERGRERKAHSEQPEPHPSPSTDGGIKIKTINCFILQIFPAPRL